MSILFLDLEWNTGFINGDSFDELIEIGAVKTDSDFNIIDSFNRYICPSIYKKMNPYIAKLLHFRLEDLNHEEKFVEVYRDFVEWSGDVTDCYTWSTNDFTTFLSNISYWKCPPVSIQFHDLQAIYSILTENSLYNYSLKNAMEKLSIKIENTDQFHDAYYDACGNLTIAKALYEKYHYFPSDNDIIGIHNKLYGPKKEKIPLKYSVRKTIHNKKNYSGQCPICGERVSLSCWYYVSDNHFVGKTICPDCNEVLFFELICQNFKDSTCDYLLNIFGINHKIKRIYEKSKDEKNKIKLHIK